MKNITFEQLPEAVLQIHQKLESLEGLLLKHNATPQVEGDKILDITQASFFLNRSVSAVRALISRNEIPYSKKAGRLYFSKCNLMKWIDEGRKLTKEELDASAEAHLSTLKIRR